jgi:hypothetical protein
MLPLLLSRFPGMSLHPFACANELTFYEILKGSHRNPAHALDFDTRNLVTHD